MLCHDGLFGLTLPKIATPGWTRMIDTGVAVDENHEPRFPVGAGTPHPDALLIDYAVRSLPQVRVDWKRDRHHLMGELAPYVGDNDPICGHMATSPEAAVDERPKRNGRMFSGARVERHPLVEPYELTPAALIMLHARLGTRPIWDMGPVRLVRGKPAMIGRQYGKGRFSEGSHCPLVLEPSAPEIAAARFEYMCWHTALVALAGAALNLKSIAPQQPAAPAAPWRDGTAPALPTRRVFRTSDPSVRSRLPLKPVRERALPPLTGAGNSSVRHVLTTSENAACCSKAS